MMRVQLEKESAVFELATAIASGGEATIYAVPERPALVAKVYRKPVDERAAKLAAMIAAPPEDPMAAQGHASIAWPSDRLLNPEGDHGCLGFIMPRVDNARTIFDFYNPARRLKHCPLFHYGYLLRTARNLAAAVHAIHQRGYVVGDLNESNILVNNQALVTLVDTDSFQVPDNGRVHRCLVGKPECTAPEFQKRRFADFDRGPEQDAFALAVLVFQLLMQGMHPFNGRYTGAGEPPNLGKRIAAGHCPYVKGREMPYEPNPLAPPFAVLPPPVQDLMQLCFGEGHDRPEARPSAARWRDALRSSEKLLVPCPLNPQHHYHQDLDACPWCELAKRFGRDPFPSPDDARARMAETQTELPAPTPTGSGAAGASAARPAPATLKPRGKASDPNIPLDVLPIDAPARKGSDEILDVLPVLPTKSEPGGPRRPPPKKKRSEPSALLRLLANPAVWLIPAALIGLLILALVIHRSRSHKQEEGHKDAAGQKDQFPRDDDRPDQDWSRRFEPDTNVAEPVGPLCRMHHDGEVLCVAFSPDGRKALTGSSDYKLRLWRLPAGELLHTLEPDDPNRLSIRSVAFCPDGKRAVSGSGDGSVRLWDLEAGQEIKQDGRPFFEGHPQAVGTVAVSRAGNVVVSASEDGTLAVWDLSTGQRLYRFDNGKQAVWCVALSRDGSRALSGSPDGRLHLWDLKEFREINAFGGHNGTVICVALSPDGKRALSGGGDRTVRQWNLETFQEEQQLGDHTGTVFGLAYSPDGGRALTGSDSNGGCLWDVKGNQLLHRFAHENAVTAVAISPAGRRALTGSRDKTARLWALPDPPPPAP